MISLARMNIFSDVCTYFYINLQWRETADCRENVKDIDVDLDQ